ncbi:Major facilitator superfamily protein [Euphorbia peplus]|nr:Major facilitator superfamily protein [Euphorbia peplus]
MEISNDQEKQPDGLKRQKGGLRTMPFIIANEAFANVAAVGLQANMIKYLITEYNLTLFDGASILFIWGSISSFTPLLGAFLSDSYLGRFRVIVMSSFATLLGLILLWLTAIIKSARPPHCDQTNGIVQGCASPDGAQLLFLFTAFGLMSLGLGGIKPCSIAFGADQFGDSKNPENGKTLENYFNWYYGSVGISVSLSLIFIVALQDIAGWVIGYGVPVGFMIMSSVLFVMGSSWYVKIKPDSSMFSSFARVISASWKNKHLSLSENNLDSWYSQKGSKLVTPTCKYSFLNKACVIRDGEKDLDNVWVAIYDKILCPMIRKYTKNPRGLTVNQRMGFGIIVCIIATTVAGFVEYKRRAMAIQEGFIDIPNGQVQMSAMWLIPQHCLFGFAEALNVIGQIEFYHSHLPKTMSSIGVSICAIGPGFGNLIGILIVSIIKKTTTKDGISWVSDNLNRGHIDYYYWVISCLSFLNFVYYLVIIRGYRAEDSKIWAIEDVSEEEEEEKN